MPTSARRTISRSRRSPWISSTPAGALGKALRAITRTECPSAASPRTTWAPRKPVPPVTRIFTSPPPAAEMTALSPAFAERNGPTLAALCRLLPFRLEGEDLSVPQRLHRFLRQVSHLAITLRARHSLGPGPQLRVHQRRSDLHLEVLPLGEDRSFRQRLVGPPQVERQQVDLVGEGEIAGGRLELQQLARGRAGP